jgi:hypothetical protein
MRLIQVKLFMITILRILLKQPEPIRLVRLEFSRSTISNT